LRICRFRDAEARDSTYIGSNGVTRLACTPDVAACLTKFCKSKFCQTEGGRGSGNFGEWDFESYMSLSGVSSEKTVRVGLKVRDWSVADSFQTF
jgi:hypothetical protein